MGVGSGSDEELSEEELSEEELSEEALSEEVLSEELLFDEEVLSEEVLSEEVLSEELLFEEVLSEELLFEEVLSEELLEEELVAGSEVEVDAEPLGVVEPEVVLPGMVAWALSDPVERLSVTEPVPVADSAGSWSASPHPSRNKDVAMEAKNFVLWFIASRH